MSEVDSAIEVAQEVGKLKGEIKALKEQREQLNALIDGMQDDLDSMRERAVKAETELAAANKTLAQIDDLGL